MARRGDYSPPKLNARERYLKRVQRNRIVGQLNQLRQAGYTAEDIREAGSDAWYELGGAQGGNYTVSDGDNLSTIAANTGAAVPDILAANPDVKQVQTGMVLNLPRPGFDSAPQLGGGLPNAYLQSERTSTPGGLPSNAALGVQGGPLSTYQDKSNNPFANVSGSAGTIQTALPAFRGAGGAGRVNNPNILSGLRTGGPLGTTGGLGFTPVSTRTPPNTYLQSERASTVTPQTRQYAPRENLVTLLDSIVSQTGPTGRYPSELELRLLVQSGRVKGATAGGGGFGGGGGGGYSYRSRRGGGGRGRAGRGGGVTGEPRYTGPREPAFAGYGGFRGLVNWRI